MIAGHHWLAWSSHSRVESFVKFLRSVGRDYDNKYAYNKRGKAHLVSNEASGFNGSHYHIDRVYPRQGTTTLCGREIPHVNDMAWWSETEEPTRDKCKLCVGMAERRGLMN